MSVKKITAIAAVSLAMAVAGCTNNPSEQVVYSVVKETFSPKEKTAPPDARALAEEIQLALDTTQGPLAVVSFQGPGTSAIIRQVETNGAYRTWGSWGISERRSLTTRNGMVTATRGLGRDVMSSDIDGVQALIAARRSGTARRVLRFIDGNNQIFEIAASCTVSNAGAADGAGVPAGAVAMTEACVAADRSFDNRYVVAADGTIIRSSQWLGDYFEQTVLQKLR